MVNSIFLITYSKLGEQIKDIILNWDTFSPLLKSHYSLEFECLLNARDTYIKDYGINDDIDKVDIQLLKMKKEIKEIFGIDLMKRFMISL